MLHGKTTLTCWPFGQEAKIFFICMVSTTVDTANLGNYSVLEKNSLGRFSTTTNYLVSENLKKMLHGKTFMH